ncbi:MAG: ATP-binding protein, partial [Bacteroidia bacterium]
MLRLKMILLSIIALCTTARANNAIDSLLGSLTHKNDSNDCKTYQRLCFKYLNTDLDSAQLFAKKALEIAKELSRESSIITSKNAIGLTYYYKNDFQKAKLFWHNAWRLANKKNDQGQEFRLNTRLGIVNSQMGYNDSARLYFNKAKEVAVAKNDSSEVITCLTNIAVEDFRQGFHDKAIPLNLEALEWYLNNYSKQYAYNIANTSNNLASSFVDFKDWVSAKKYAQLGKRYSKKGNYYQGMASSNTLFGIIYSEQGMHDSAQYYYNIALHGLAKSPSIFNTMQLYNNKAQSFTKSNKLDSSFFYLRKSIKLSKQIQAPLNLAIALMELGEAHLKKGNVDSALVYTRQGRRIAVDQEFNTDVMNSAKLLSAIFSESNLNDSAYFYLSEYVKLSDSLNSIEAIQKINAFERVNEQKNQKIKLRQIRIENALNTERLAVKELQNKYLIVFTVILLLFTGALIVSIFTLNKTRNKLKFSNAFLSKEKRQLELKSNELNAANETLKETQAQLIQSEKLASLGQLTAGIAHEINNPINFVKAGIESLKLELDDVKALLKKSREPNAESSVQGSSSIDEMINEIEAIAQGITNGAERTAEIVKGLRVYARTGDEKLSSFNVKESIENTLLLLKNSYKDRIKITTAFDQNVLIDAYGQKLDQVFMNVISNAIQAITGKGEINIESTKVNRNLEIKITDGGSGILPKDLGKVFDPFYTTKEVGKGTGLGLAICMG